MNTSERRGPLGGLRYGAICSLAAYEHTYELVTISEPMLTEHLLKPDDDGFDLQHFNTRKRPTTISLLFSAISSCLGTPTMRRHPLKRDKQTFGQ